MLLARANHGSLILNRKLFVICGTNGMRSLRSIEMMDLAPRSGMKTQRVEHTWELIETVPTLSPRQNPLVCQITRTLAIIIGGAANDHSLLNDVHILDSNRMYLD